MQIQFFYGSIVVIWIAFAVFVYFKHINLASIIIGITTTAYSMIFDTILGSYKHYYYYISKESTLLYITLAAVLIYPILNIIYTMFLPKKRLVILIYTLIWIAGMLIFELASFWTKTIVLTGWKMIPWSYITYILTYAWMYAFYKYLIGRGVGDVRYFKARD